VITVTIETLRTLQTGGRVILDLADTTPYRKDSIHEAGTETGPTTLRVQVAKLERGQIHLQAVRQEIPVYLTRDPASQHADYTTDTSKAAFGEPEPVTGPNLTRIATQAHIRYQAEHADELARQHARSIGIRLKDAAKRGDKQEIARLSQELTELLGPAA
jgi:hypothetical protein